MEMSKQKRPGKSGALPLRKTSADRNQAANTSSSLGLDSLGVAVGDADLARLRRLRDLAHEIDVQEPVLERGASDLDMLGELEDALERARRDALIEHLALLLLGLGLLLALDRQGVLLGLDRDLGLGKARNRERDAVGVLAGTLDVVGRIGRAAILEARYLIEHRKEPVESDGRAIEGSKIESTHGISSLSDMLWVRRKGRTTGFARAGWPRASPTWEGCFRLARGARCRIRRSR